MYAAPPGARMSRRVGENRLQIEDVLDRLQVPWVRPCFYVLFRLDRLGDSSGAGVRCDAGSRGDP